MSKRNFLKSAWYHYFPPRSETLSSSFHDKNILKRDKKNRLCLLYQFLTIGVNGSSLLVKIKQFKEIIDSGKCCNEL